MALSCQDKTIENKSLLLLAFGFDILGFRNHILILSLFRGIHHHHYYCYIIYSFRFMYIKNNIKKSKPQIQSPVARVISARNKEPK